MQPDHVLSMLDDAMREIGTSASDASDRRDRLQALSVLIDQTADTSSISTAWRKRQASRYGASVVALLDALSVVDASSRVRLRLSCRLEIGKALGLRVR